jgi:hypothetical protein
MTPSWLLICKLGRKNSSDSAIQALVSIAAWLFLVGASGFEPLTPSASRKCSPPELRA